MSSLDEHEASKLQERPYSNLIDAIADLNLFEKTFTNDSLDSQSDFFPKRTGLVFNSDCVKHYCIWDQNYEENPNRFTRTFERLNELGLIEKCSIIKPRKATKKEILLAHTLDYITNIYNICSNEDNNDLEKESSKFDAIYFNQHTYESALYAAGSVIEMVDHIVNGTIKNGFALVRPPGHHAMKEEACGYCIFNNVAIAALHCLNEYHLKRILIVDWDVHHGQGIQQCFYDDDRILYVSLHRYENGAYWPELIESNYNFIGDNKGRGFNINVPLNKTGIRDTEYISIWHNLLLPIFYEFNPELVLVAGGYDAAIGCPEGEMLLTPAIYGHLTHYLMGLANGKLGVILEGGYCLESLCDSVASTLQTLLGSPPIPFKSTFPIDDSIVESVLSAISVLRSHWNILKFQNTFDRHLENESVRKRYLPFLQYKGLLDTYENKPESYPTRNCYPIQEDDVKKNYLKAILILREHLFNEVNGFKNRTCLIKISNTSRRHCWAGAHPERPNRIDFIWKFLQKLKVLDRCFIIKNNNRYVTEEQLLAIHSSEAIAKIKESTGKYYKDLREYEQKFDSIYFTQSTFEVARLAAGALLNIVDEVLTNNFLNGFAIIRPPGHHASKDDPAGFCIFNNICIAAHYAINEYKLNRILIIDWDVHHGDGTQKIVKNDERILFISLHRYDHANFYPETTAGNYPVAKNIINIPWNNGPMGDKEYLAAFCNIVMPIAYAFNPELVLVSAGFDSAKGDPLGEYQLSPQAYGHMTHMLCSLAKGKIVMSLEGGYNLKSIAESVLECILVLLGDPPKMLTLESQLNESSIETIMNVIDYHASNWPCFVFNVDIPKSNI